MGDVSGHGRPSDAHRRLLALVAEAQAEGAAPAVLDVRSLEPVIDLRGPTVDGVGSPRAPSVPDPALTLVLNRVRYRLFGLAAVRSLGPGCRGHLELAALASRATPPDIDDLVRQRFARRSIREGARPEGARPELPVTSLS